MIQITDKPIDVQSVINAASNTKAGAVNVFIGTVRDHAQGETVVQLEYETYDAMAIAETQKILDEASRRWPILATAVSHRTGILKPGEVAVVVAIATPHRKESFEACQYVIDTLKEKVPIWKKEVFADGAEWINSKKTL